MNKLFTFLLVIISINLLASDWVPNEILVMLNNNVKGSAYDNFLLSYSGYDLNEIEVISSRLNLIHFSFNSKKISAHDFLSIRIDNNYNSITGTAGADIKALDA